MAIPRKIQALIDRLNEELDRTEQQAIEGLNLVRPALFLFPDNAILMQFFATINNVIFAVEIYRRRIQVTGDTLSAMNVDFSEIQEAGEELATILGLVLEAKIRVERIISSLENLS